jgi:hypothetical protein
MIVGLIAQHVPARADRCLEWFSGLIEGRRSIRSTRRKTIGSIRSHPDGEVSEVPEAAEVSGLSLDGKPSEAGVPLKSPPPWNTVSRRIKQMVLSCLWKDSESKAAKAIRQGALG